MKIGDWYLMRRHDANAVGRDAVNNRVRIAAHGWARTNGLKAQTRSVGGGRELYVRFVKRDA